MSETCELILVDDGSRDRTYEKNVVNFIAIKKHKAVTLSPLLPYVYDSLLLIYGRKFLSRRFIAIDPKLSTAIKANIIISACCAKVVCSAT